MSQSAVVEFTQSLSRASATSSVATRDGFDEALDDAIEEPAIGAQLPFPDISLANHPVTLDPSPRPVTRGQDGRDRVADRDRRTRDRRRPVPERGDEPVSLFPERHVVVVQEADIRPDLESAFDWLREEFDAGLDSVVFETGPSATGDMGALVQGVHGPSEVHVIVVEDDA